MPHTSMENVEGQNDVTLEILKVLKEINGKLDAKQENVSGQNESNKAATAVTASPDEVKPKENATAHPNEQGLLL